jgi:hypothetical protein
VLVGSGDIAVCGSADSEATARLLDRFPGTVFTTGDNAYPSGTASDCRDGYDPTWGRHRHRTRPTPGNHDYETSGATGYFDYFGTSAGPYGQGYYSYTAGSWQVIALNSEIDLRAGSAQYQWLRSELTTNRSLCTAAYWHRPLFSSGPHGDNRTMVDAWRLLYQYDVEVVMNGHDHIYERFAPQTPDGVFDPSRGITQFVIGTGGARVYQPAGAKPNSEIRGSAFGVLALTLADGSYSWEFVPVEGAAFHDSGTAVCH